MRGAIMTAIDLVRAGNSPRLYVDEKIDNARYYWQFYAIATRAEDLSSRVEVAPLTDVLVRAPSGAIFITAAQDTRLDSRAASGEWQLR